jgi:regulator of sirC expression with transglutaminase-like and TPR domain
VRAQLPVLIYIRLMTNTSLLEEFEQYALESSSILEGALLVARIVEPDTDTSWCRQRIQHLAETMGEDVSGPRIARKLKEAGFTGSEEYYKSQNSALEHVLRKREGIPISLAVVMLAICEELQLQAHGVNFPSHFLVSVQSTLIDPFSMKLVNEADCMRWLKDNNVDTSQAFAMASRRDIVLRMLNNLGMLASANNDHARALDISDYKLAITADRFYVNLERVDLWLKLGVNSMARQDLELAIGHAPDESTRQRLQSKLAVIRETSTALH